jgi:hypothetical protein
VLVERRADGIVLTARGREVQTQGLRVMAEVDRLREPERGPPLLRIAASPELAFTVDGWFGKIRFESGPFSSAGQVKSRDSVQNIRLGLVFKY